MVNSKNKNDLMFHGGFFHIELHADIIIGISFWI